jgi:hypothetical protein
MEYQMFSQVYIAFVKTQKLEAIVTKSIFWFNNLPLFNDDKISIFDEQFYTVI